MITIDKMFEYDFGIDYSDSRYSAQEIARQLRAVRENRSREHHDKVLLEIHKEQGFWHSLIKEDIMNKAQK